VRVYTHAPTSRREGVRVNTHPTLLATLGAREMRPVHRSVSGPQAHRAEQRRPHQGERHHRLTIRYLTTCLIRIAETTTAVLLTLRVRFCTAWPHAERAEYIAFSHGRRVLLLQAVNPLHKP